MIKVDIIKYKCKFNDIDQFFNIMSLQAEQLWTKKLDP